MHDFDTQISLFIQAIKRLNDTALPSTGWALTYYFRQCYGPDSTRWLPQTCCNPTRLRPVSLEDRKSWIGADRADFVLIYGGRRNTDG